MSLELTGVFSQQAASKPKSTAESSHLISACPNWHLNPYEQHPFFQKPLHFLPLEVVLVGILTSSCLPWANLHLRSQGQNPSSSYVLQSSVLCLEGLVLAQKNSSSLSELQSDSLDLLDVHSMLQIFEKLIELLFKFYNLFINYDLFKSYRTPPILKHILSTPLKDQLQFALTEMNMKECQQYQIHTKALIKTVPMSYINLISFKIIMKKEQLSSALFTSLKRKYEGYPQWYEQQLAKREPINISKFKGDLQSAVHFYFNEVNKLYFANSVLNTQLNAVLQQKNQLNEWIEKLEQTEKESFQEKKKRVRRCANQIERKFICQVPNCDKSYGTEGSMAQHMRLKHPQIEYNGICSEIKIIKEEPGKQRPKKKEERQQKP